MTKARILSFLMVVCLATTCMLSGTIAKYTTNDSNNDDAIVGKWGVILGIDGTLFGKNYLAGPTNTATDAITGISVQSSSESKLVAPGTKNEVGMTITLEGTPEVGVEVSIVASGTDVYLAEGTYAILTPVNTASVTEENFVADKYYTIGNDNELDAVTTWSAFEEAVDNIDEDDANTFIYKIDNVEARATVGEDGYYPVVYSFTGLDGVTKAADFAELLNGDENTYIPNTDLSDAVFEYQAESAPGADDEKTVKLNDMQITWGWTFTGVNDAADSVLGALIAEQKVVQITTVEIPAQDGEGDPTIETTYTVLVADGTDANLFKAGEDEVAYLKTSLNIVITVEQVD